MTVFFGKVFWWLLSLGAHATYVFFRTRRQLHLLQLNSYYNRRYFKWLWRNKASVFKIKELEPLWSLGGSLIGGPCLGLIVFILVYLKLVLDPNALKSEKKPLVFTLRAIRILVVNLIFLGCIYGGWWICWWYQGDLWFEVAMVGVVGYGFLIPLILAFANWLLSPLEWLIQFRYLRKAKKVLGSNSKLIVIGITGSFGKTTTKYILAELLKRKFNVLKTPGSYNTLMGVTRVILDELKPLHEIFIVEMSAKRPKDIKKICDLVNPSVGLITSIGEQHLEFFKTFDKVVETKSELFGALSGKDKAFLNLDDPGSKRLVDRFKLPIITYGFLNSHQLPDYYASELTVGVYGSRFKITAHRNGQDAVFNTQLLGRHNVHNILGAVSVAVELGVSLSELVTAVRLIPPVAHRLELKIIKDEIIFIDDAFNANVIGSKNALEVLAGFVDRRKIIVTPGLIELGAKERECNENFGKLLAAVCDYVILVGKNPGQFLLEGVIKAGYPKDQLFMATDFNEAMTHLQSLLRPRDVVLFENDLPDNYS